ncbi:MAG: hypothetical protein ACAH59_14110, partial [Pseudobdellovibrionaceae bacterium]
LMVPSSQQQPRSSVSFQINGKINESLHLGDKYRFEFSGFPPNMKLKGYCEGPSRCTDWFFFSFNGKATNAKGRIIWPNILAPNWDIPLTRYTLWVTSENGQIQSNRVTLELKPKIEKARPFPSATIGSGLQLLVDEELEANMEIGLGVIYLVEGGTPNQELVGNCTGPMNPCKPEWFFPENFLKLGPKGVNKASHAIGIGSPIPIGKYQLWLTSGDGKTKSNNITLNITPSTAE